MKSPLIFISHAGADRETAEIVAARLKAENISVLLDSTDLAPGSDFVEFMDSALCRADYCLLLWSREAEGRAFVKAEWQAAFAREAHMRRIFLLIGRLEDHPVPPLLLSRLHIDLFPSVEPGVARLIRLWRDDRHAAAVLGKEVLPALNGDAQYEGAEIYVSSELFDCVVPLRAALDKPAGLLLDAVIAKLSLPRRIGVNDRIGMEFTYNLLHEGRVLERRQTLAKQGMTEGSVLSLEVVAKDFASVPAVLTSSSGHRRFRNSNLAHQMFLEALAEAGLRRGVP